MRKALVVGAGIAGLTAAIALENAGWSVQVLEREPDLRASGTTVLLRRTTIEGLTVLGLGFKLAPWTIPLTELQIRNHNATSLAPLRREVGSVLIDRSELVRILKEALPERLVSMGRPFSTGDLCSGGTKYDLVVGADGVHSTMRRELFGQGFEARATGTVVWRGTADLATAGLTEYWGHRRRFGVSDRPSGGTNWYATAALPPSQYTSPPDVSELHHLFGNWCSPVAATVAAIDENGLLRHDIQHLARRLPSYYRDNVALIGDAAHAMTPDLGRGANEAVLDALSLAHSFTRHTDAGRALASYDHSRRRRTQLIATASATLDTLIHARGLLDGLSGFSYATDIPKGGLRK